LPLSLGGLLAVEADEIDGIDVERREAAVANGLGHHLAREGKQQARALDHDDRVKLVLGHVADSEHAGIGQLELEQNVVRRLGVALEGQVDLEIGLGELLRIHVHLDADLRPLLLRCQGARCVRVLEREVVGVLRERVQGRRGFILRAVRCRGVGHEGRLPNIQ
jgi:hypothetical protein